MALLLPDDYAHLNGQGVTHTEDEAQRFFVLRNFPLTAGLFQQTCVDVLIQIPSAYPDQGIDMYWTSPRLQLTSGAAIAATSDHGANENVVWNGHEYCRWSRHWEQYPDTKWRPGTDAVHTILQRIRWCLNHPNPPPL